MVAINNKSCCKRHLERAESFISRKEVQVRLLTLREVFGGPAGASLYVDAVYWSSGALELQQKPNKACSLLTGLPFRYGSPTSVFKLNFRLTHVGHILRAPRLDPSQLSTNAFFLETCGPLAHIRPIIQTATVPVKGCHAFTPAVRRRGFHRKALKLLTHTALPNCKHSEDTRFLHNLTQT